MTVTKSILAARLHRNDPGQFYGQKLYIGVFVNTPSRLQKPPMMKSPSMRPMAKMTSCCDALRPPSFSTPHFTTELTNIQLHRYFIPQSPDITKAMGWSGQKGNLDLMNISISENSNRKSFPPQRNSRVPSRNEASSSARHIHAIQIAGTNRLRLPILHRLYRMSGV